MSGWAHSSSDEARSARAGSSHSRCYDGILHTVATATDQATLEAFQGDPVWNHVRFNTRLINIWWSAPRQAVIWKPTHQWWFTHPPNAPEWKSFDLRRVAQPHGQV
jgi:hypothetical protein